MSARLFCAFINARLSLNFFNPRLGRFLTLTGEVESAENILQESERKTSGIMINRRFLP